MTVLEALAVLEAALLECKKRDINTPEIRDALNLLEPYIQPDWLIPQFRNHALKDRTDNHVELDFVLHFHVVGWHERSTH